MILWKLEKEDLSPYRTFLAFFHKGSASFMIPFLSLLPFFANSLYKRTCNMDLCFDYFSFPFSFFHETY